MTQVDRVRPVRWRFSAFALVLFCLPAQAGDDPDKRKELVAQIEDKVEALAEEVGDVASDASERPIDDARRLAYDLKRLAEQLENVAGDDAAAKTIADRYPDDLDELLGVVPHLRALHQGQHHAQAEAQMCTERDRELVRQAHDFEAKNDPDGLAELPRLAAQYQDATKQAIEGSRRDDDKLEDAEEETDDYAAEGALRAIDGAIAAAGRVMYAAGHQSGEVAEKACERLLKGVDHPEVKDALAKLGRSAGGRKAILEQLERDARELASTLAGVSEDAGLGSVERAKALLAAIERGVEALGGSATTDKAAKLVLATWPDGIRQLDAALDDLEDLKLHQHAMDPLPGKCEARVRELADAIARNGNDTDGVEELPKLADALAQPVIAGLDKARERLREEVGDLARAKAIAASDGPWSDIRAAAQRDADETFKTFEDGFKQTEAACANVILGSGAPVVRAAVENLQKGASSDGSQLERDVAAWEARARATYLADCQGLKDIWAGFCSQDWEPGDEGEQRAAGIAVADPIKDTMRAAIDGVLNDAPALEVRVKALADKRETQKLGKSLQRELKKQQERLVKLRANPALNGNYDLMLQFSNAYGKQQHERMWKEYSCKVPISATTPADFPREGKPHYKPDCIEPESCMIWEFKPKGKAGEARGEAQRDSYQHNVPIYYNKLVKSDGTYVAAEASLGGIEIMNRLMQKCYRGGAIELTAKVVDYDPCKEQYECTTD